MTGLIADAQGVYHDLTKGAFDAFSIKNPAQHLSTTLLNQPVAKGMKKLADEFGVDLKKYQNMDVQGAASALAQYAGKKLGVGLGAEALLGKVAVAAEVGVPTGGLAVLGLILESAIEWGVSAFKSDVYEPESFLRGDWVVVDDGQKTVAKIDREIDLGMSEMFEDAPTISELHVFERVEAFHVGFYVSSGKDEASSTIFDLMTGNVREHLDLKIKKLPLIRREELDNDPFASEVRELYFTKQDHVLLDCEVSCDPGTEVIYKNELWNIVRCEGDVALIEAGDGARESVPMVALSRARQERANSKAWRYTQDGVPENNGFNSDPGGYGTGDWVWVERGVDWELAVCHIISGDNAVVYMTQSGFRLNVPVGEVRAAMRDVTDLYNRLQDFVKFKLAAVAGRAHDTRRLRLPSKYRSIIREINPEDRQKNEKPTADNPTFRPPQPSRPVETQAEAEALDTAEQIQNMMGVRNTKTQEWGADEQVCRRRMLGKENGGDLCRTNDSSPYGGFERTTTTSTVTFKPSNLLAFGAAAVVGWYFFMR
jgi:hypothetical protein